VYGCGGSYIISKLCKLSLNFLGLSHSLRIGTLFWLFCFGCTCISNVHQDTVLQSSEELILKTFLRYQIIIVTERDMQLHGFHKSAIAYTHAPFTNVMFLTILFLLVVFYRYHPSYPRFDRLHHRGTDLC